jgi:molecular chaperone DnaK (HSP70)
LPPGNSPEREPSYFWTYSFVRTNRDYYWVGHENFHAVISFDSALLCARVETAGGVFTPVIKRNSTVPTKRTETFTTSVDNQTRFVIRVYEGNDPRASHNTLLVAFQIDNIPPFPRGSDQDGKNQIEVTVEIDESHVAKVFAFHAPTNRSVGYEITDRILKFDWSKEFPDVGTSAPAVIPARQQLGARGKRE